MNRFSAESLLRRPVRVDGLKLGHPVDVVIDREARRVLGLEVLCGDDAHRFLPLSAARIDSDHIAVGSALTLLSADELAFYRKRGTTTRQLRGALVTRKRRELGQFEDVVASADGAIVELVVAGGIRVPMDESVRIQSDSRRDAA